MAYMQYMHSPYRGTPYSYDDYQGYYDYDDDYSPYVQVSRDRYYLPGYKYPVGSPEVTVTNHYDCDCVCHPRRIACRWNCLCVASPYAHPSWTAGSPQPCAPWYAPDAVSVYVRPPPLGEGVNVYLGLPAKATEDLPDIYQRPAGSLFMHQTLNALWEGQQAAKFIKDQTDHRTASSMALLNATYFTDRAMKNAQLAYQAAQPGAKSVEQVAAEVAAATTAAILAGQATNQVAANTTPQPAYRAAARKAAAATLASGGPIYIYSGEPTQWHLGMTFANLSPSSAHPIEYRGVVYPTAMHLWQAFKFEESPERMVVVSESDTPKATADELENEGYELYDWNGDIPASKLIQALTLKYDRYPELIEELLATENRELKDLRDPTYNVLGYAMEKVRHMLYEESG